MRVKLVGGAYQEEYSRFSAQRCVNWYPHMMTKVELQQDEKPGYLKPTPGLVEIASVAGERVRALYSQDDRCFFVVGKTLYQIVGDNVTTIGEMEFFDASKGQRVYLISNGNNQLGIFGGDIGYYYDIDTATLAQITDVDYPGAETAEYMDGYAIVTKNGRAYFSELNDFSDWRGDSVFTPTYESDALIHIMKLRGIIWNFGTNTIEPYYNDGTTPFTRTPQASIDIGLYAKDSVGKFAEAIVFVGRSNRGSLAVYMLDSKQRASIISPGSITRQINIEPEALKSSYAIAEETKDGHQFYHLIIPDSGKTFTYDLVTLEWHERSSIAPYPDAYGNDIHGQWRANCFTEYRGEYIIGDFYSGKIFKLDPTALTEDGTYIRRQRTIGTTSEEQKYLSISDLTIDCSMGITNTTSPKLLFSASHDGGYNYHTEREIDLSNLGGYGDRLKINKLGTGRNWAIKLTLTDEVNLALFNAYSRGTRGSR